MIDAEPPSCWQPIRAEMQRAVSESTWHQWLEPLRGRPVADGKLLVEAPDAIRPWVVQRFGKLLQACAERVLGTDVEVEVVAPGSAPASARPPMPPPGPPGASTRARRSSSS